MQANLNIRWAHMFEGTSFVKFSATVWPYIKYVVCVIEFVGHLKRLWFAFLSARIES